LSVSASKAEEARQFWSAAELLEEFGRFTMDTGNKAVKIPNVATGMPPHEAAECLKRIIPRLGFIH
jgi:hypothetical protein